MNATSPGSGDSRRVGITTTVPIEILYAAGLAPLDLNNVFATHPGKAHFGLEAEKEGLPRTICGWNKGVFIAALLCGIRRVVEVIQGDCSTSEALGRFLEHRGIEVIPFAYPFDADAAGLREEMARLAERFGTGLDAAEEVWREFRPIRELLGRIDALTWQENRVSGFENHLYLVSGSDLNSDPALFRRQLEEFLSLASRRTPIREQTRIGYVGVPPMVDNLYQKIEELGGRVVFNETQRQFSMCQRADSMLAQYRQYTYPYSVFGRIADIRAEIERRRIAGLVHYVQSFCFHQLEDQILRRELPVPLLTLEIDRPGPLDSRDEIRLENFLRMLSSRPAVFVPAPGPPEFQVGLDLGSRWVKLVLVRRLEIVHREKFDTIEFYKRFAAQAEGRLTLSMDRLVERVGDIVGEPVAPDRLIVRTTGYGRHLLRLGLEDVVPELQAHVAGVRAKTGLRDFTLLDIGGQDTKVIQVRGGRIADFLMNDRCAAGGGRYLENMARLLGLEVEEMGLYHLNPVSLSSTCATFGESEVVGRIVEGHPLESICAGVNATVVQRILPDLRKMPSETLVVSGGVAHNRAILHFLEAEGLFREILVPPDPEYTGAAGALCADSEPV